MARLYGSIYLVTGRGLRRRAGPRLNGVTGAKGTGTGGRQLSTLFIAEDQVPF